jgi:hypothetical protein
MCVADGYSCNQSYLSSGAIALARIQFISTYAPILSVEIGYRGFLRIYTPTKILDFWFSL